MDGVSVACSLENNYNVVHQTFLSIGASQHRGKACAGIAIVNKEKIHIWKGLGRVGDVLNSSILEILYGLHPFAAIGNVGYTKNKYPAQVNAEPIRINPKKSSTLELVLTMDGYLLKENEIKAELEDNYHFETTNKTEVIGALFHHYLSECGGIRNIENIFEAGKKTTTRLRGRATFALGVIAKEGDLVRVISLNDERAYEPFCYGITKSDHGSLFLASSESCSLRRQAGRILKEHDGAEMTICYDGNVETKVLGELEITPDSFQAIYYGSLTSMFRGQSIYSIRTRLGRKLVEMYGVPEGKRCVVLANPESGRGVTVGVFEAIHEKLFEEAFDFSDPDRIYVKNKKAFERLRGEFITIYPGLVRQPQAVRTFQEDEIARFSEVGLKFLGVDDVLEGADTEEGEDSYVRGSVTEGGSMWAERNSGVVSQRSWVSCPSIPFPSFKQWYRGRKSMDELLLQRAFADVNETPYGKSMKEINERVASFLEIQTMRYMDLDGLKEILGPGQFSFELFDGGYPPIDDKYKPAWLMEELEKFHSVVK